MKQPLLILIVTFILGLTSAHSQEALTHKIMEAYDDDKGTYTEVLKETYAYYSNGKLSQTEFSYMGATDWTASVKMDYSYHSNGFLEETITSNWNDATKTYMNNRRDFVAYDGDNIKEQISYSWVNNAWKADDKTTFNYVGNVFTTYDTYEWENSKWENDGRGTIEYDGNQKISLITTEEYEAGVWVFEDRTTFKRDQSTGRITEIIYEEWNGTSWEKDNLTQYMPDTKGNRKTEIYSESNDGTSWIEENKIDYDYDYNTLMSKYNNPFHLNAHSHKLGVEDIPHYHKVVSSLQSENEDSGISARGQASWEIDSRTIYYYSDDTMGLDDLSNSDFISVFPNPVINSLNITLKDAIQGHASLYDINGRLVMEQPLQPLNSTINVQNLNSGFYVLKIATDIGFATKRITKN